MPSVARDKIKISGIVPEIPGELDPMMLCYTLITPFSPFCWGKFEYTSA